MTGTSSNDILDVAIVGGGVSGVYSAWRLMRDSGNLDAFGMRSPGDLVVTARRGDLPDVSLHHVQIVYRRPGAKGKASK